MLIILCISFYVYLYYIIFVQYLKADYQHVVPVFLAGVAEIVLIRGEIIAVTVQDAFAVIVAVVHQTAL